MKGKGKKTLLFTMINSVISIFSYVQLTNAQNSISTSDHPVFCEDSYSNFEKQFEQEDDYNYFEQIDCFRWERVQVSCDEYPYNLYRDPEETECFAQKAVPLRENPPEEKSSSLNPPRQASRFGQLSELEDPIDAENIANIKRNFIVEINNKLFGNQLKAGQ